MPTADQFLDAQLVKILYVGDSGAGKTGSLVSLIQAGYSLKVMDMDKNIANLILHMRKECPDKMKNLEYESYTDIYRATGNGGLVINGIPQAFINCCKKLTEWSEIDDPNTVFVLDTLSATGRAAFAWAKAMNPLIKDNRQIYGFAQTAVEDMMAMLTGDHFKMNVIVNSHIRYAESDTGPQKGYANSVGQALNTVIPRYFSTFVQAEVTGTGNNIKREIRTLPTGIVDLKTPPIDIPGRLPLETGLATIFAKMKGQD